MNNPSHENSKSNSPVRFIRQDVGASLTGTEGVYSVVELQHMGNSGPSDDEVNQPMHYLYVQTSFASCDFLGSSWR